MNTLTDRNQRIIIEIQNEGTFSLEKGENVLSVLTEQGLFEDSHCGGRGTCGKCVVRFLQGAPLPMPADRRRFSPQELRDGFRLACMAKPQQSCKIELCVQRKDLFIMDRALYGEDILPGGEPCEAAEMAGDHEETLIVTDLGTTTMVLLLVEKKTGRILDTVKKLNPQKKYGADVVSRMQASISGRKSELSDLVKGDMEKAVGEWRAKGYEPEKMILAGNTVMVHLLMEYDVTGISKAPFTPVTTASVCCDIGGVQGETVPGISAFVGGDVVAGMLVCRRLMQEDGVSCALLVDLGTNGEMVLFTENGNWCTATAAGPAFEGGFGGRMYGTDVIAAVAGLLQKGIADETGLMKEPYFSEGFTEDNLSIRQTDIRHLQEAKAAVFAGIRILMEEAGVLNDEIGHVYLAGGFGYKLNVEAACEIGLIPVSFKDKTTAVGNTALAGGYLYHFTDDGQVSEMIKNTKSINLAEKEQFGDYYLRAMELRGESDFT